MGLFFSKYNAVRLEENQSVFKNEHQQFSAYCTAIQNCYDTLDFYMQLLHFDNLLVSYLET
jgi:hypothetical protein